MAGPSTDRTSRGTGMQRALLPRIAAAVALAVSAYVHVDLALGRPWVADGQVTLAGLFIGDAVAAAVTGLWVLVQGSRLAWLVAGLVALVSALALLVTTYVQVPAVGPLPSIYDPLWYPDKSVAFAAAAVASVIAAVVLAVGSRRR